MRLFRKADHPDPHKKEVIQEIEHTKHLKNEVIQQFREEDERMKMLLVKNGFTPRIYVGMGGKAR